MPMIDWRLWKAQVQAESAFKAGAVSPVGAMGLSQIMPATFADIGRKAGIKGNPFDPEVNLMAGSWYMATRRQIFKAPRPDMERHKLAAASYNAGAKNIIKAQNLAGNPRDWEPVAEKLPAITGRHAKETTDYIRKIQSFYKMYLISGD